MLNIVVNIIIPADVTTFSNITFHLDGDFVAYYTHVPTNSNSTVPAVSYNKLVYSNDSLDQEQHTLQIVSSGNTKVLTLFDYIIYATFEEEAQPSPSYPSHSSQPAETSPSPTRLGDSQNSTHASSTGIIAGGAVGGAVVIFVAACLFYVCHIRRIRCNWQRAHTTLYPTCPSSRVW